MQSKVVLVTGANGGLGTFVTRAFLDAGFTVIGSSREIRQDEFACANFMAFPADIGKAAGAKLLAEQIETKFGKLDVVAHTVGGFAGGTTIAETTDVTFHQMFDLNLNATFYLLHATIPLIRKSVNGRIIAIGSRAAKEPGAGIGAYSASKAAMVSLIQTAAIENRDAGVTANVILPGTMDTQGNRKAMPDANFSQWVKPEGIAALMLWLASDNAKDVNGAVIPVYGVA